VKGWTTMLLKETLNLRYLLTLMLGLVAFELIRPEPATGQETADAEAKIESAMSAAPLSISQNATILDNELGENGEFVLLREGSNDWYCSPVLLSTPGDDPWCYD
jgi:hypothetical protein